jgi:hypothetical protein
MKTKEKEHTMKYQIVKTEDNKETLGCFDLYIKNIETGEEMVADQVRIWNDDQESLEDMFETVKNGEWK